MLFHSWHRWSTALLLSLSLSCTVVHADSPSFENTAVVRTIELEEALTHITTRYSVRALQDNVKEYTFALGEKDGALTSWVGASIKGGEPLALKENGYDKHSRSWTYVATLPEPLKSLGDVTLEFKTVQSNAGTPLPAMVAQENPQSLKYSTDLFVISPYATTIQRTKVRTPTPQIHDYSQPTALPSFTEEEKSASKSGSTITYGPYSNIPPSANSEFSKTTQQRISIHYEIDRPVLRVLSLNRIAEVSHWGSNLNIQDEIHLKNDGAKLKGQFSRLLHQVQSFQKRPMYGTLTGLRLHLPAGISDPYFIDLNGNVSTSSFRPSPSSPKSVSLKNQPVQFSILELKPRYPIVGGWSYNFTLGWDAPLGDSVKYDAKRDRYVLGVPFWTPIPGASVDEAEVTVILPEGATDVEVFEPFAMRSVLRTVIVSYLDTTGRPAIVFNKDRITDSQTNMIYVTYKIPLTAHLKKPVAVGTAMLGVFILALFARRVDPRIGSSISKKK
ncbi:oligosaccharyl transferase alpha subunit [Hysterangium stoloniferum]|nr:oligosaccharyl transferase alpha subunit [Hysterangium stoloniferum]